MTTQVLSLIVAALGILVGPLASWLLLRRQLRASMQIANKQIVAPMRQAWINGLRDQIAELASAALHYHTAGFEERSDDDYLRLTLLEHKIVLMLNPLEEDHKELERSIRQMISSLERGRQTGSDFFESHTKIVDLSREIFKREWNRVKEQIQPT